MPSPAASLRIALAQLTGAPGDLAANTRAALAAIARAADGGAGLVAFPELFLSAYDLPCLAKTPDAWLAPGDARLDPLRRACEAAGVTAILGAPLRGPEGERFIAAPIIGPRGDVGTSL